jgi:hypothetical protein
MVNLRSTIANCWMEMSADTTCCGGTILIVIQILEDQNRKAGLVTASDFFICVTMLTIFYRNLVSVEKFVKTQRKHN